jgi:ubiquinone/menaquinone biosynthesis C-methylase UbiE
MRARNGAERGAIAPVEQESSLSRPAMDGAAAFDRVAERYEQIHDRNLRVAGETSDFFVRHKVGIVSQFWREAGLSEDSRFLDFGCGIGRTLGALREALPSVRYTGVDPSAESIREAEKRHRDMQDASFRAYDGGRLPFADSSFEMVFAAAVFHHIQPEQRAHALGEIARVLAPGGWFVVFEHNPFNPATQYIVKTCEFDDDAVLLTAPSFRRQLRHAGFAVKRNDYVLFLPKFLRDLAPSLEAKLRWLPAGAQYWIAAQKPR